MENGKEKGNMTFPLKAVRYLRERGLKEFKDHALEKISDGRFDYNKWIRKQMIGPAAAGYQKKLWMKRSPIIYILISSRADNSGTGQGTEADKDLERTIASVNKSTYSRFAFTSTITSLISDDDFILPLRSGDMISSDALFEIVKALQGGADAVYTDEDSYQAYGGDDGQIVYKDPLFKPDFSPDYLMSMNYIGSLFAVRAGIVRSFYSAKGAVKNNDLFFPDQDDSLKRVKEKKRDYWDLLPGASSLADEAAYYDFVMRCAMKSAGMGGTAHVAKVLCHVKKRSRSMISPSRLRHVPEQELIRQSDAAFIEGGPDLKSFHIRRLPEGNPLVSIIIPSKDQSAVLRNCLKSIEQNTSWQNREIIIVENNSVEKETFKLYDELRALYPAVRVIDRSGKFNFSSLVNEGAAQASGEYLVLMNNDVTVKTADWIERLLGDCQTRGVGIAGPKLLYPDGRVQSAGITVGLMGFAGSMMVGESGEDPGYMNRASVTNNFSALTAACMMVSKKLFQSLDGFTEELAVALNDVDFCLKAGMKGYRCLFDPTVVMIHHESLTRGGEDSPEKKKRFKKEKEIFVKRWGKIIKEGDPYYNPNLSGRKCDYSQRS